MVQGGGVVVGVVVVMLGEGVGSLWGRPGLHSAVEVDSQGPSTDC